MLRNPKPADMKYKFCRFTVRQALVVLAQGYNCRYKQFYWGGQHWTVEKALEQLDATLLDMPCGSFGVVGFRGGPPLRCDAVNGTILTMLCDQALFAHYTENMNETEKLGA